MICSKLISFVAGMLSVGKQIENFYIHIPFCVKKCFFCAFPVHAVGEKTEGIDKQAMYRKYCEKIQKEIKTSLTNPQQLKKPIQSVYFGGGTPSLLSARQIGSILQYFKYGITNKTQITLQMNAQEITKIEQFMPLGINRVSLGIQSLNQKLLNQFNRGYKSSNSLPPTEFRKYLAQLSKKSNLNLDFIVDFNSDPKDEEELLDFLTEVRPKHLSLYVLEINQGSYLYKNSKKFACRIDKFQNFQRLSLKLAKDLGYNHYEVSNFCLPGFQSLHNSVYWKGNKPFGGFGMGATSFLNSIRVSRPKNLAKYFRFVEQLDNNLKEISQLIDIHSQEDPKQQAKWIILSRLRTKSGLTWQQLQIQALRYIQRQVLLQKFKNCKRKLHDLNRQMAGIVDLEWIEEGIRLKVPYGFLFVDEVAYRILECLQI